MAKDKYNHYSQILDQTARRVKQFAQTAFISHNIDLTVDQWTVMKTLHENRELTQKELAEKCGKDQPTLTRIVDLIIKKNYVERVQHPSDRRSLYLHLTAEGKTKVENIAPTVSKFREKAWENLTQDDFAHFSRILNTIYKNLEQK